MKILKVNTKGYSDIINITDKIQKLVDKEKVKNGLVHLFVLGSTASLSTCEDDSNIYKDIREVLEEIASYKKKWRHHQTWGDRNRASHIRATMLGPSLTVPVVEGRLLLDTWQSIVLLDFDTGARERKMSVNVVST